MDKVWTRHWPPGIDEAAIPIRLPAEPLPGKILKGGLRELDRGEPCR
jgi:hypothetical protein